MTLMREKEVVTVGAAQPHLRTPALLMHFHDMNDNGKL